MISHLFLIFYFQRGPSFLTHPVHDKTKQCITNKAINLFFIIIYYYIKAYNYDIPQLIPSCAPFTGGGTFSKGGGRYVEVKDAAMRCRVCTPSEVGACFENVALRVRAFFHKTVRVCHVYCNFKIGFTCWISVIFGTLKDGSLLINTLASNICFSYRNMFQNGVDTLSKIVDAFLSKSLKFYLVRIIR